MSEAGSVLVTGASTGIGRATALYLDAEGFDVFAAVRKQGDAESLKKEASERLRTVHMDLLDARSIRQAGKSIQEAVGEDGLVGLVNNAGIGVGGPLEFLDLDELRLQLEVNVVGQVAVTQSVMPALRRAPGRIVNISSIGGRMAAPIVGPYAMSKFAVEAMSDSLRVELKPWGIHVAVIEPGAISTPIFEKAQDYGARMTKQYPKDAVTMYGEGIEAVMAAYREMAKHAIPAENVARAVHHAITARRPRTRYRVGFDAKVQGLIARFVPDRLRDVLLTRMWNYPT